MSEVNCYICQYDDRGRLTTLSGPHPPGLAYQLLDRLESQGRVDEHGWPVSYTVVQHKKGATHD